jgi:cytoskeletal protein RodZ
MVDPATENAEEKPLDPAMARVQVRLQRLMLIAGLTLGLGILAVFAAIVYRITAADNTVEVVASEDVASDLAAKVAAPPQAELPAAETAKVADDPAPVEPAAVAEPEQALEMPSVPAPAVEPAQVGDDPMPDKPTPAAESEEAPEPPVASASAEVTGQIPVPVPSPRLPSLETQGQVENGSVPTSTDDAILMATATVPADARLIASTVAGGRIVLTYDHYAGTIVIVVDPETLQVVGRLDLKPQ